jgi:hypothetical protein
MEDICFFKNQKKNLACVWNKKDEVESERGFGN